MADLREAFGRLPASMSLKRARSLHDLPDGVQFGITQGSRSGTLRVEGGARIVEWHLRGEDKTVGITRNSPASPYKSKV